MNTIPIITDLEVSPNHWVLNDEDDVLRFVEIMSVAEAIPRLLSVEQLDIEVGTIDTGLSHRLALLLDKHASALHITHLRLAQSEKFLGADLEVAESLSKLVSLKKVYIDEFDETAAFMLMLSYSQLELVEVSVVPSPQAETYDVTKPLAFLHHSWATLTTLTMSGPLTGLGDEEFPMVRDLGIELSDTLSTRDIARVFPNLCMLTLLESVFTNANSERLQEARARNQAEPRGKVLWHDLTHVVGDVSDVYTLALPNQVRFLTVTAMSKEDTQRFGIIVKDANPGYLSLTTSCARIGKQPNILRMLRQKRGGKGIRFELHIEIQPDDTEADVRTALVRDPMRRQCL